MLGLLLFFGLWCVIIGFLVRWELNKESKLTETQIAFYSAMDAIASLGISFRSLVEPTRKAAKAFEAFGEAYERAFNVPE